jgi:hypothetical protein
MVSVVLTMPFLPGRSVSKGGFNLFHQRNVCLLRLPITSKGAHGDTIDQALQVVLISGALESLGERSGMTLILSA